MGDSRERGRDEVKRWKLQRMFEGTGIGSRTSLDVHVIWEMRQVTHFSGSSISLPSVVQICAGLRLILHLGMILWQVQPVCGRIGYGRKPQIHSPHTHTHGKKSVCV
ncbi:hypothetical protein L1987_82681 [Smallanthus sonchifolius]|uniref:Uncharacterized protein n=1 Tax=Smallanthus sonchifolius TaxID=185202 RepID=A0ACB8YAC2_9ASTR|nr:hypothetical protein L1987_82681 [Smallanthus sonchifolius]